MKVGMALPSMVAGLDRATILEWIRLVDEGPFSVLGVGERLGYPNQEMWTLLAAAAALTERVRIEATVCVLPIHSEVMVAKQSATVDVLSGGRFTLGVGVGGRDEDFRLVGAPFAGRFERLDAQVGVLRRVWAGEPPIDEVAAVGPRPVQHGGPPILTASMGPKSMARSVAWADGIAGFDMAGDSAGIAATLAAFDDAWADAGRSGDPFRQTSFWFGLGDDAPERVPDYARRYLAVFGDRTADALASLCGAVSEASVSDRLRAIADTGCDEVILVSTTSDPNECRRAADLVASL